MVSLRVIQETVDHLDASYISDKMLPTAVAGARDPIPNGMSLKDGLDCCLGLNGTLV